MPADISPTARALQALELLHSRPGINAERLADKLGVSERAARRYVAILRESGIPIESVRGRYGGYQIGRGLRLPPLTFTAGEAVSLVMAVLDGHHDAAGANDAGGQALGKIMRALPESLVASAEVIRRTAAPAPDRSAVRPDPDITSDLVRACADGYRVRVSYRSERGSAWEADVDPWAVVIRHSRWYLLCWSHASTAQRAYRVDRIGAVTVLDTTFRPPVDLDPVEALEAHLAAGWDFAVDVIIDAPADTCGRYLSRAVGRLEPIDAATTRLVGSTSNPTWYAEQLAVLPAPFRVVDGGELRDAVRTLGDRLLAATT